MKRRMDIKPYIFPMPVLMVATYGPDGTVDVMNVAWGGACASDMIALNISEGHKTSKNIKERGDFTVALADAKHIVEADFFGMVSGNRDKDKFAKSGLTAKKSDLVDAPVIEEFPVTLECHAVDLQHTIYGFRVLGQIKGVLADADVLDAEGKIDPLKVNALIFDKFRGDYYTVGEKAGTAWSTGSKLMK
jgi:flavin reductase (DIM6/NTAB) family NADH-FMN oxidoreductase RutF